MSDHCKMKLVSLVPRERVAQVVEEWKDRYHLSEQSGTTYMSDWARANLNANGWLVMHNWSKAGILDTENIYEEFLRHGDTLTLEKIVEILGGPSSFATTMVRLLYCDICKRYDRERMVVFLETDCDRGDISICPDCLQDGVAFYLDLESNKSQ